MIVPLLLRLLNNHDRQHARHPDGARTVHVAVEGDRGLGGLYKVRTEGPPLASIS
jgi:hypothetical protein